MTTTQCAHEAEASFAYPLAALTRGECLAVSRKRYGLRRLSIASERREARRRADLPAVRGHGAVTSRRGGAGPRTGPARDRRRARDETGESEAGERGRMYSKIKLHLTRDGSPCRIGRSREARPFRGTSWPASTRAARPLSLGVLPDIRLGCPRRTCGLRTPRRDPCAWPARESLRKCAAGAVPDGRRTPDARGVGGGLCELP